MHDYQQVMVSWMHSVVCTKPDMAYTCGKLALCTQVRVDHHWEKKEWSMKYLMATGGARLVYRRGEEALRVVAYFDGDDAAIQGIERTCQGCSSCFEGPPCCERRRSKGV